MRLSRIKLAGFKSFVDPTSFQLPTNLVGIVGPNGCGKSNVIDAVRWVMGEMSAKHLRGESMADVIFNGSSSRKPVGAASIELFFDNSDGSIGGQYAQYSEIALRRTLARDGTSSYFLNGARCRRKDITDLFLGTGLGSRSYAIIEQGMVSRLIDAKPDEMRAYIEEAAGISKYKERRRETETRIQHTRDNLARLTDLREEITKQIDYLQRQAKAAERYKELKGRERRLVSELLVLRLTDLERTLNETQAELAQRQTALEAAIAEQRRVEAGIVHSREQHVAATEIHGSAQARHYSVQSEISRLEQSMAHVREIRDRQQSDLTQSHDQVSAIEHEVNRDRSQLLDLNAALGQLEPEMAQLRDAEAAAAASLAEAERALDEWQDSWQEYNLGVKEVQQTAQVEQTRCEHLAAQLEQLRRQQNVQRQEHAALALDDLDGRLAAQRDAERQAEGRAQALEQRIRLLESEADQLRQLELRLGHDLERMTSELASCQGQMGALKAVQDAALRKDDTMLSSWLSRENLTGVPRLAQQLRAEPEWVQAVETVLGDFLQAICVEDFAGHIGRLPDAQVTLVERMPDGAGDGSGTLLAHVANPGHSASLLRGVLAARDLDEAVQLLRQSSSHQSVITRDGIWLGHGWVRVNRGQRSEAGVLTRENQIRDLSAAVASDQIRIREAESRRDAARARLAEIARDRGLLTQEFNLANRDHAEALAVLENLRQDVSRVRERRESLAGTIEVTERELKGLGDQLDASQLRGQEALSRLDELAERRPLFQREQADLLSRYAACQEAAEQTRSDVARRAVEIESRRVARDSIAASLERMDGQRLQLQERIAGLLAQIGQAEPALATLQGQLSAMLEQQLTIDRELVARRDELEQVESALRDSEAQRSHAEKVVDEVRGTVEELRIKVREAEVRRESVMEDFRATGADIALVRQEMSVEAECGRWQQDLDDVRRRIERLGPINLAAIEQHQEQAERKKYLDAQNDDLTAALETLEQAIRKIDHETRSRFQETFESVNQGLKRIFPRLFGGGHAYLSLEGEDVLAAGVTVMARPPGKRNSSIHLLSGGEKALTAVALIFSIFELNPAPFCLLDEVDAPLDEANVGRFCDIVREMSQRVQFVVITHNKTTMEMANQLIGVTMNEPGVSRLVSVDLDAAVQLAAS